MARPRWCVHVELQNTDENVTSVALPETIGPVDVVRRGVVPARMAQSTIPFYARNQASDLPGFFRLDENSVHAPVTLTRCVDVPMKSTPWVETASIDFVSDGGVITFVKSRGDAVARIRAGWTKKHTSIKPKISQLRVELVRRVDNRPLPPDFMVMGANTFSIANTMATYSTSFSLKTWWGSNHRLLLRCVGRFYRYTQT